MKNIFSLDKQQINDLREIRKLLDILNKYGDVLVNAKYHAHSRFKELTQSFIDKGYSLDDISDLIDELHEVYYPVNQ